MTAKYENVHWENRDGIAIITIDRPKALNALNMATMKELHALFAEVAHDETVDVIILTGAGEKAFVAGADIKEMAAMDTLSGRDWGRFGQAVTQQLEDAPQPVIAAVNGRRQNPAPKALRLPLPFRRPRVLRVALLPPYRS